MIEMFAINLSLSWT